MPSRFFKNYARKGIGQKLARDAGVIRTTDKKPSPQAISIASSLGI